jgi:hypothetical protein
VNFYNLAKLNSNLKKKIHYRLTFSGSSVHVSGHFQRFLLYFTGSYNYVTESDGLKSLFHVEINIRNSKIAVRKQHKNNFMQLYNKNVKINV